MMPGAFRGSSWPPHAREAAGRFRRGELTAEQFNELEGSICRARLLRHDGDGQLHELRHRVMGLSLPGCGTAHAVDSKKLRWRTKAGRRS